DTAQARADAVDALTLGGGGSGDVVGPASATDGAVALVEGTTGKLVKDGGVGEDDGTRGEKELEGLTKKFVEQIDEGLKLKEAELLEV
ncbi:MAG TPA: hypothetical protein PLA46_12285, partial [Phycicoccus sp.]|nr:hypothetical protein [Phycicoccus sp.]